MNYEGSPSIYRIMRSYEILLVHPDQEGTTKESTNALKTFTNKQYKGDNSL
jgi:hypothetical protein